MSIVTAFQTEIVIPILWHHHILTLYYWCIS